MTRRMKQLALIGVPLLVLAAALIVWLQGGRHISTENAFVKADIAQIASEVPGRITELHGLGQREPHGVPGDQRDDPAETDGRSGG